MYLDVFIKIVKYFYIVFIFLFLFIFNIVSFQQIILYYILYCAYVQYSSKAILYYTKNKENEKILSNCPNILNPNFKPYFFFPFAFQQSFICASKYIISKISSNSQKEFLFREEKINNYGLRLYWPYFSDEKEINDNDTPILLILPGMTGTINDPVVRNCSIEGLKKGYHVCVYQMRIISEDFGVDESQKFTHKEDINLALDTIRANQNYGKAKIFAIGYSYGANNLLYYLGDIHSKLDKKDKKIIAGVSISNPFDMKLCQRLCEYNVISCLVSFLERRNSRKIRKALENCKNIKGMNIEELVNCYSVKKFDEIFSAKIYGNKSADDYYRNISSCEKMENIDIPVLCINSYDDPMTPKDTIAYDEVKLNPNLFLIVTDRGSHMSFISNEKLNEFKQWHFKPVFEFFYAIDKICNIK